MTEQERGQQYGIYVHIPFCKAKCKYCAFVSTSDFSLRNDYIDALLKEIDGFPLNGICADTVYIGGGTPSCLPRNEIYRIMTALDRKFVIDGNAEITVECNPESASDDFFRECLDSGINRINMGLQSADDKVLREAGRIHTYSEYLKAVNRAAKLFDNISSDIILGLPKQTESDAVRAIETICEYCDHASVYALTVEEGTPLYKSNYIPDDDFIADLYDRAYSLLQAHGFDRYEVSNFARNGKQSRHNNKYWNCIPYIGLGVAAHGYDGEYTRYYHENNICGYIENTAPKTTVLTEKDRYNEYVMLRLRTKDGIDLNAFRARFGFSFEEKNKKIISQLVSDGYISVSEWHIAISPKYLFVMNGIIEKLMLD